MRGVRQAVSRCERAGLRVTCHRVGRPRRRDPGERAVARPTSGATARWSAASRWRSAASASAPTARRWWRCAATRGELRGLLHFVPWGADGLSLDLMRRDRDSENGIVEQMVAGLMAETAALGVRRVSLNFAVFRSVFARGERLGAGPVLRVWRAVLLWASRFWQIESLYRANAKYQPEWVPRFVCFRSSADLPRVSVAALRVASRHSCGTRR